MNHDRSTEPPMDETQSPEPNASMDDTGLPPLTVSNGIEMTAGTANRLLMAYIERAMRTMPQSRAARVVLVWHEYWQGVAIGALAEEDKESLLQMAIDEMAEFLTEEIAGATAGVVAAAVGASTSVAAGVAVGAMVF